MQRVTVGPPIIKRNIGTPDEGERSMVDVPIQRSKSLVYLSYMKRSVFRTFIVKL
jgi:hypothetical protein